MVQRRKNFSKNAKKKKQSMDATKKNYFRNAEKYEWMDTEAERSIA